jgi:signal transduction histidine kinase
MKSFLGVPIVGRRGSFGNLYLTEKIGGGEFTEEDERIARLLAAQAAAVVENTRLHEESARLIEEVQQLQRSRERFFATVNHELRNALAAVYGWAEMLVRKKDPATVPPAALEVLDSAEQAVALINDLLDLSRLDEDRLRPVLRPVDCATLLRRAASRLTPAAQAKQVELVLETPVRPVTAHTDASRVEQILTNLLGNAVRHTPAGSRVHLRLAEDGGVADFTVRDEGSGIPDDELETIFDIYVTKAGEEADGHGLGLPLSRRLASLLRGDLIAMPNPRGGGLFRLRLPLAAPPDSSQHS